MSPNPQIHKSVQVLSILADDPTLSQRAVAKKSGLSLGLVNLIIQRLLQTGHIKISNMSKKKVRYILTTRGFKEKANQSCNYLVQTVSVFMAYKERVDRMLNQILQDGHRHFAILGQGELTQLLENSIRTQPVQVRYRFVSETDPLSPEELLVDCRMTGKPVSPTGVRVLAALLEAKSASSGQTFLKTGSL